MLSIQFASANLGVYLLGCDAFFITSGGIDEPLLSFYHCRSWLTLSCTPCFCPVTSSKDASFSRRSHQQGQSRRKGRSRTHCKRAPRASPFAIDFVGQRRPQFS